MSLQRCSKCGNYFFSSSCNCKLFKVQWLGPDDPYGEVMDIYATDFEVAAVRLAVMFNEESGDYPMMQGDDIKVSVTDRHGVRIDFCVNAEPTIQYNTTVIVE